MKHCTKLWALAAAAALGGGFASADTVASYTVDFNTPIDVSTPSFLVAPNWGHIVDKYNDGYFDYYMGYKYEAKGGVDASGSLLAYEQRAGDNYDYEYVSDYLITPKVTGSVQIALKLFTSGKGKFQYYAVDANGKVTGSALRTVTKDELSTDAFTVITIDVPETKKLAIKAEYVYMDNFIAEQAEIGGEPALKILTASPSNTTGVIYWDMQPDGSVVIEFTDVTVQNIGTLNMTQGMENYTVSVVDNEKGTVLGTVPIPQDLAMGETTDPFNVRVIVPADQVKTVWSFSSATRPLYPREDIGNTTLKRANSGYYAYESKFVFRFPGQKVTSNMSLFPVPFGVGQSENPLSFEIYNDGIAPLTVKSVTLPEGYSITMPEEEEMPEGEFQVGRKGSFILPVSLTEEPGNYLGNLRLVYLDNAGAEKSFEVPLNGHSVADGVWYASFNNGGTEIFVPAGCIGENAISPKNNWFATLSHYDYYLATSTTAGYANANNKFITRKLHAAAGDRLYFEAWKGTASPADNHMLKVVLSTDRITWSEPLLTLSAKDDLNTTVPVGFTVTIPEEGDYFVGFSMFGVNVDNIIGLTEAAVDHTLAFKDFTVPETAKSGEEFTVTATVYQIEALTPSNYVVKVYVDGEEAARINSINLPLNWKSSKDFSSKITLNVEETADKSVRIDFEFNDGTVVSTGEKTVRVTYAPEFGFYKKDEHGTKWYHDSLKTPIAFGKTNVDLVKEFEIYNWGSAPLTVKSITLPEGFVTEAGAGTVPSLTAYPVVITFTHQTPGAYEGNVEITYVNPEGEDQTYTLGISGTKMDPAKWYATFENGTVDGMWPPGSVYQSNVSLVNHGLATAPNIAVQCSSSATNPNRMFVSPRLRATENETLSFDAKIYSTQYNAGGVKIWYAATRNALLDPESSERTELADFRGKNVDEAHTLTTQFATYSVTVPEGTWFIGFEIYDRCYVDEIFGLEQVSLPHEWNLLSVAVPQTAMQNIPSNVSLNVQNFGLQPEPLGSYDVTVYVDGLPTTVAGNMELPIFHKANEYTTINASMRHPKVGTFPVCLEISAGDYSLVSETREVEFVPEELVTDVQICDRAPGTDGFTINFPLNLGWKNSETIALYTPEHLSALADGEKISQLILRGLSTVEWTTDVTVAYQLTDEQTMPQPTSSSAYDFSGMTVAYQASTAWPKGGSEANPADLLVVNFDEPLVYEAGKALKLLIKSTCANYKNGFKFESSAVSDRAWYHRNDGTEGVFTGNWLAAKLPVLHLVLDRRAATLSGSVTDRSENPVENATVLLVSNDGDNIQYETCSADDGTYTLSVIQSNRGFDVAVAAEGLEEYEDGLQVEEEMQKDFVLRPVYRLHGEAVHQGGDTDAVVYLDTELNEGYNLVAFPVALAATEIEEVFGNGTVALSYAGNDMNGTVATAKFAAVEEMEAGVPYLLYLPSNSCAAMFRSKDVAEELTAVNGAEVNMHPVSQPTPMTQGMYVIDGLYLTGPSSPEAAPTLTEGNVASVLPAYSAYLEAGEGVTAMNFVTDAGLPTEVEEAVATRDGEDTVYDLGGIRVRNPKKGLYIINGKAVLVK